MSSPIGIAFNHFKLVPTCKLFSNYITTKQSYVKPALFFSSLYLIPKLQCWMAWHWAHCVVIRTPLGFKVNFNYFQMTLLSSLFPPPLFSLTIISTFCIFKPWIVVTGKYAVKWSEIDNLDCLAWKKSLLAERLFPSKEKDKETLYSH